MVNLGNSNGGKIETSNDIAVIIGIVVAVVVILLIIILIIAVMCYLKHRQTHKCHRKYI